MRLFVFTLFFIVALAAVAVIAAPVQPPVEGAVQVTCSLEIDVQGNNGDNIFKRHFVGSLVTWFDPANPRTPLPIVSLTAAVRYIDFGDRPESSKNDEISLYGSSVPNSNRFVTSEPYFTDEGTYFKYENANFVESFVGYGEDSHQLSYHNEGPYQDFGEYEIDCGELPTPQQQQRPNGGAVGDPSFTGFLGQKYQVHGMVDTVHNILSAPKLQINALFVYLESGVCPVYVDAPRTNCWSHPGTYFGEIGVKTSSNERLMIVAGGAFEGFRMVTLDGVLVGSGSSYATASLNVTRTSTHMLTLTTELFEAQLENSDKYINLVRVRAFDLGAMKSQDVHGLLGQTWKRRSSGQVTSIEGNVDDYVELGNDVFGDNFIYNRFQTA